MNVDSPSLNLHREAFKPSRNNSVVVFQNKAVMT